MNKRTVAKLILVAIYLLAFWGLPLLDELSYLNAVLMLHIMVVVGAIVLIPIVWACEKLKEPEIDSDYRYSSSWTTSTASRYTEVEFTSTNSSIYAKEDNKTGSM